MRALFPRILPKAHLHDLANLEIPEMQEQPSIHPAPEGLLHVGLGQGNFENCSWRKEAAPCFALQCLYWKSPKLVVELQEEAALVGMMPRYPPSRS